MTDQNHRQVGLRRMFLVVLDAALILFSFYFALLLRADGAVKQLVAPTTGPCCMSSLDFTALYLISFVGGLYSILWKYAGERDLIRLAGMIAVPTAVVYFVNHGLIHGVLFDSANAMAAVLIFLLVVEPPCLAAVPEPPHRRAGARRSVQGPEPPGADRGRR